MHHHHASFVGIWVSMFASAAGGLTALFCGVWSARHPGSQGFDFIASARRIRARSASARDDG